MAFPDTIVTFPTMQNVSASDGALIKQYQAAIEAQNMAQAATILAQISNYTKKIITASYLNSIASTTNALETYYLQRYSPAYIVSATQPATQGKTDFWFQITGTA